MTAERRSHSIFVERIDPFSREEAFVLETRRTGARSPRPA